MAVFKAWSQEYSQGTTLQALNGVLLVYSDTERLSKFGRVMAGYANDSTAVVGYSESAFGQLNTMRLELLTKHELSHCLLLNCGVAWDEKIQHAQMARHGF